MYVLLLKRQAIGHEDGLDGGEGEEILKAINAAVDPKKGTVPHCPECKRLREALAYVKGLLKSGETIYAMRIIDKALTAGKGE